MKNAQIFALLLFLSVSCKQKDKVTPEENTTELKGIYNNTDGKGLLSYQLVNWPARVKIDPFQNSFQSINCSSDRICLSLPNVRFENDGVAYEVIRESTETFEILDGNVTRDVENQMIVTGLESLDFVLVLDLSNSLEADLPAVKKYAQEFIDQIAADRPPTTRVGLVVFSDVIDTLSLTTDFNAAKAFIENHGGGAETKLYESVDTGLKLLANSTAKGKAIITFTDGINNSWSDPKLYQGIEYVSNRLKTPIQSGSVSSYTIGLKKHPTYSPNEGVLKTLAQNGGIALISKNIVDLKTSFKNAARGVLAGYSLTYRRNNNLLSKPIELQFKLQFRKIE